MPIRHGDGTPLVPATIVMPTENPTAKTPAKPAKAAPPDKAERDRKDSELEREEESERGNAPPEE